MAFVFFHCTQHTDTHLVSATEQLQTLLMLRADLPVQVADFIHQLVPLKSGRLVVRLQVLLAVGRQTHQAGLDGFELLADADVAAYVLGSGVVVVRGRRWRRKGVGVGVGIGVALERGAPGAPGAPGAFHAPWSGSLVVGDPAIWAEE